MAKVVDLRINFALGGQPPTSFIIRRIIDKEIKTMIDEYWTWIFYGYHSDDLKQRSHKPIVTRCDMCCKYRISSMGGYRDLCRSCALTGIKQRYRAPYTEENKKVMSERCLAPKNPLPDGWTGKLKDLPTNKESAIYLGNVAEIVLSNTYENVQVMPIQNHGYDFICNMGCKVDVKSSATGHKGHWTFHIYKNVIADYFLCLAFESRSDLRHPAYLWLIPGHVVNHLSGLTISKNTIHKWDRYAIPVDKVLACCHDMHDKHKV